jgi:micrococcal nuclease
MGDPPRWTNRKRQSTPRFWIGLLLALVVAWRLWSAGDAPLLPPLEQGAEAFVKRAVDGDTLLLVDGRRVRLLGVDTPETKKEGTPIQPWGLEAHTFTEQFVEGRSVRLEFDKERHDKYGRVLAYVYADQKLLNEELIRAGLGRAILNHPYRKAMKRRFRNAEKEARRAHRGIWGEAAQKRR